MCGCCCVWCVVCVCVRQRHARFVQSSGFLRIRWLSSEHAHTRTRVRPIITYFIRTFGVMRSEHTRAVLLSSIRSSRSRRICERAREMDNRFGARAYLHASHSTTTHHHYYYYYYVTTYRACVMCIHILCTNRTHTHTARIARACTTLPEQFDNVAQDLGDSGYVQLYAQ